MRCWFFSSCIDVSNMKDQKYGLGESSLVPLQLSIVKATQIVPNSNYTTIALWPTSLVLPRAVDKYTYHIHRYIKITFSLVSCPPADLISRVFDAPYNGYRQKKSLKRCIQHLWPTVYKAMASPVCRAAAATDKLSQVSEWFRVTVSQLVRTVRGLLTTVQVYIQLNVELVALVLFNGPIICDETPQAIGRMSCVRPEASAKSAPETAWKSTPTRSGRWTRAIKGRYLLSESCHQWPCLGAGEAQFVAILSTEQNRNHWPNSEVIT